MCPKKRVYFQKVNWKMTWCLFTLDEKWLSLASISISILLEIWHSLWVFHINLVNMWTLFISYHSNQNKSLDFSVFITQCTFQFWVYTLCLNVLLLGHHTFISFDSLPWSKQRSPGCMKMTYLEISLLLINWLIFEYLEHFSEDLRC